MTALQVTSDRLTQLLAQFSDKRVLVMGDIILDKYLFGNATRLSPEAPVPIVKMFKETLVPGGAANSANNIVTLGGKAHLMGVVGTDSSGRILRNLLHKQKIQIQGIMLDNSRPTIIKTRVIAHNQQLIRIDHEQDKPITRDVEQKLLASFKEQLPSVDIILISDYNKGLMTPSLSKSIINAAKQAGKNVIVDTKQKDHTFYKGAYLITPNLTEASNLTRIEPRSEEDITRMGRKLVSLFGAHVLITRGKEGMTLFQANKRTHLPTKAQEVFDVSGAGDTVASMIALSIAAGASLEEAMVLANNAAGIVVGKLGTATVHPTELRSTLKGRNNHETH